VRGSPLHLADPALVARGAGGDAVRSVVQMVGRLGHGGDFWRPCERSERRQNRTESDQVDTAAIVRITKKETEVGSSQRASERVAPISLWVCL